MISPCKVRLSRNKAPHCGEGTMANIERPGVALDPEEVETRAIHDLIDFIEKDVLEIGCGEGRLTRRFASEARSVLGVDLDAESIALAPAQLPESLRPTVRFQVADITALE